MYFYRKTLLEKEDEVPTKKPDALNKTIEEQQEIEMEERRKAKSRARKA